MLPPPPLRTDGSNAFARYSMQERVPAIARVVRAKNPDYPASIQSAIERLASDIEHDALVPPPRPPDADQPSWEAAHRAHAGETWLNTDWFYAELAFYRELTRVCRFWETGRDPFAPVKEEELQGERPWLRMEQVLSGSTRREGRLGALLEACLWGNRVDLSYTIAAGRTHAAEDDLIVDERDRAIPLLGRPHADVHVVADNTGTELALDLALVAAILAEPTSRVTIHLKLQPIFVSDAMARDVWRLVERMQERGGALGRTAGDLRDAFASGRLSLLPDPYWSSPFFLWDAPAHLRAVLGSASIVVLKGDANYRRVVGDAVWPADAPFARACAYFPAPLVCLRTMKSDPVLGLPSGLAERLDAVHPTWRIDGQRGVLQVHVPSPSQHEGQALSA